MSGARDERRAIDPLDIPWAELATPEGAPTPDEKRRQREVTERILRRVVARTGRLPWAGVALFAGTAALFDEADE